MDELIQTLVELVKSGVEKNTVVNMLFEDYIKFHWVRFIVGSLLLLICAFMTVTFLKKAKSIPINYNFEKNIYKLFGGFGILISLAILLIVVANASVLISPLPGFEMFIYEDFSGSTGNKYSVEVLNAFTDWLERGTGNAPAVIESEIQKIANVHRSNVIIFGVSGVSILGISVWIWKNLIKKSNKFSRVNGRLSTKDTLTLVLGSTIGSVTIVSSILLIVMAEVNLRWAISPFSAFLFYS